MRTSFSLKAAALAAAVVVGSISSPALADHQRWELRRFSAGPRADYYVYVRTDQMTDQMRHRERPYALTGSDRARGAQRDVTWPTPLHPKGPRSNY
jgi:hypothetical protein